jgi:hypothetical protein
LPFDPAMWMDGAQNCGFPASAAITSVRSSRQLFDGGRPLSRLINPESHEKKSCEDAKFPLRKYSFAYTSEQVESINILSSSRVIFVLKHYIENNVKGSLVIFHIRKLYSKAKFLRTPSAAKGAEERRLSVYLQFYFADRLKSI